ASAPALEHADAQRRHRSGERLTNLELRLDDLDAKLDGIIEQIRRENTDSRASRRAAEEGR
ncbi:MAG TPA: hypothetical protein PLK67_09685, partial [Bryobacteraceae bacterium]|nr:hypothetical protein [Bryobacteraceae bacterium]